MKLRLKSHSVRFRLTTEEMEQLTNAGCVSCTTILPTAAGEQRKFRYEVAKTTGDTSDLIVGAEGFSLILGVNDWLALADDSNEGVYLRREWHDEHGRTQRTVIYVEKDRKEHKHKEHKHKKHDKHKKQQSQHSHGEGTNQERNHTTESEVELS